MTATGQHHVERAGFSASTWTGIRSRALRAASSVAQVSVSLIGLR
ncbi:MAG TPA: hypothetical protein VLL08_19575 [Kineosporiaceae bacterium]|nr:hypothetical protein [Kineosporiaceae bacterium]